MNVMEQFANNPEMTEKVLETLKNTQIAYLDETGQIVKTTLEKTLSPDQLQELIEVRLQVIDNVTNKEIEKLNKTNTKLEDNHKEHFSKLEGLNEDYTKEFEKSRLEMLDKQNKNSRKGRELEIKAAKDKLKIIEQEFGKETDQYKEQYKKLLEIQRTHKDETLNEQKNLLNERLELFEKYQEKERIALETSLEKGNISSLEFAKQNKRESLETFKEKEKTLEAEIELNRKAGKSILDLENQLAQLRLDKIKETRDAELKILEEKFDEINMKSQKEALKNRLAAIDGESQDELKIRINQENTELENKRKYLIEQMKLYAQNSKERKKLEMELKELEVQMAEKAYNDKKTILEKEFNLKMAQMDKIAEINQRKSIDGTTIAEIDATEQLEIDKINLRKSFIEQQILLTQEGTEERLKLETELEQLITSLQSKEQANRKRKIEEKYQDLNRNLNKQTINARKELIDGATLEELKSIDRLEQNTIDIKLKSLKEQLSLYEENSKEYKEIQDQILQTELELEEKKVQIKKNTLDKKLELETALLQKIKIANEELSLDGTSQSDLNKIQAASKKELNIRIANIQEQIKLYEKGSIERINLENDLQQALLENKKNELDIRKQKIDTELTLEKNKLQQIKLLNEKNSIRGSTQEDIRQIQQIQQKEIQLTINNLNNQLGLYETNSKERKEIELQLQQELNNLERSKFESQKQLLQQRFDEEQRLNNDSKNELEKALLSNTISREQYDKRNIKLQKQSLLSEQQLLSEQLNIYKQGSKEYYDLLAQLSNKQLEYQKLVIEESVQQLEKQKQQININSEATKQNIEKLSNAQDRYISNLEFESKMKQTDLDITKSLMNADISRLEFSLTQTGDLVEKAEINLQIKQKQIAISNKEIETQIENLHQQTKINSLNLEKEKIQIRLNKLDIERNTLQTQLEIKQAKLQNKSKEEITILEQQLDSLKNQSNLLNQREQDLIRNNQLEEKITENKLKELEIQQDINAERNQNDIEIAKQEKILAILEKQKEEVMYRYEKSILIQEKELKALDHIQKVEESRLKSLQQRQNTLNELMGLFDTATQMSSEGAVSEAKRDHLAKKNAEMKYKMLQISQNIERQNLEMEMKQAEIANKRLQIEHERAKLTAQSNLRQAEFDAKRIMMDKTASDIDKQRAMDLIDSRKDELVYLDQQGNLIEDQISLTNQGLTDRRKLIDFKQGIEDIQARQTIAKTTKNTADDTAITNEAFNMTNVLEKTLTANMNQFKEIQTPTIEINRKMEATLSRLNNTIEKQIKVPDSNPINVSKLADININLTDKNVASAVPDIKRQIYDALNNVVVAANQQNIIP